MKFKKFLVGVSAVALCSTSFAMEDDTAEAVSPGDMARLMGAVNIDQEIEDLVGKMEDLEIFTDNIPIQPTMEYADDAADQYETRLQAADQLKADYLRLLETHFWNEGKTLDDLAAVLTDPTSTFFVELSALDPVIGNLLETYSIVQPIITQNPDYYTPILQNLSAFLEAEDTPYHHVAQVREDLTTLKNIVGSVDGISTVLVDPVSVIAELFNKNIALSLSTCDMARLLNEKYLPHLLIRMCNFLEDPTKMGIRTPIDVHFGSQMIHAWMRTIMGTEQKIQFVPSIALEAFFGSYGVIDDPVEQQAFTDCFNGYEKTKDGSKTLVKRSNGEMVMLDSYDKTSLMLDAVNEELPNLMAQIREIRVVDTSEAPGIAEDLAQQESDLIARVQQKIVETQNLSDQLCFLSICNTIFCEKRVRRTFTQEQVREWEEADVLEIVLLDSQINTLFKNVLTSGSMVMRKAGIRIIEYIFDQVDYNSLTFDQFDSFGEIINFLNDTWPSLDNTNPDQKKNSLYFLTQSVEQAYAILGEVNAAEVFSDSLNLNVY